MKPAIVWITTDDDDAGTFVGPFPTDGDAVIWAQENRARLNDQDGEHYAGERYLYIEVLVDPADVR